ncbi:MAG: glycoside hydrolase family 5 protein [Ruminococcus sp.]|nr:glycoside hydrolase family 5 protein [Ruminococcus sp.]
MRKFRRIRGISLVSAACLLVGQLAAMPSQAASFTGSPITDCDYVVEFGDVIDTETNFVTSCEALGVPATATVEQIWVNVSGEAGKNIMPAIGYTANGYNEENWYSDSIIITEANGTVVYDIPEEYPIPNEFMIQYWWGDIDAITIESVGVKVAGSDADKLGDLNADDAVTVADAVAMARYLTENLIMTAPQNADLDDDGDIDAVDLTLLKRGILDGSLNQPEDIPIQGGEGFEQSAMEFVANIKLGWNLGNTLDSTSNYANSAYGFETAWGNPYTTKAMIDAVKAAGFNTVRVPVSWGQKMGSGPDYKVNEEWMNRVYEVVGYVLDNDMYCILNSHHDTDWQVPSYSNLDAQKAQLSALWTQIGQKFGHFDEHLIFETMNEPRLVGHQDEWNGGTAEARAVVNEMNAAALSAIRASGGNNDKRFVMMPGYCASPIASVVNDIVLPDDDHLIVSIHAYTPYDFALNANGTSNWDQGSGSYEIVQNFERVKSKFISKGIPVIVGEFGAVNKNNLSERVEWVEYYVKTAASYGIPCVWWDNNLFNGNGENFGLVNRSSCRVEYPEIMEAMLRATADRG